MLVQIKFYYFFDLLLLRFESILLWYDSYNINLRILITIIYIRPCFFDNNYAHYLPPLSPSRLKTIIPGFLQQLLRPPFDPSLV